MRYASIAENPEGEGVRVTLPVTAEDEACMDFPDGRIDSAMVRRGLSRAIQARCGEACTVGVQTYQNLGKVVEIAAFCSRVACPLELGPRDKITKA